MGGGGGAACGKLISNSATSVGCTFKLQSDARRAGGWGWDWGWLRTPSERHKKQRPEPAAAAAAAPIAKAHYLSHSRYLQREGGSEREREWMACGCQQNKMALLP